MTRQASVVKGASLAALKNSRPQKRKSRLHYGVNICMEFREGVDSETKACYNDWDGKKLCRDRMMWIIEKVFTNISTCCDFMTNGADKLKTEG